MRASYNLCATFECVLTVYFGVRVRLLRRKLRALRACTDNAAEPCDCMGHTISQFCAHFYGDTTMHVVSVTCDTNTQPHAHAVPTDGLNEILGHLHRRRRRESIDNLINSRVVCWCLCLFTLYILNTKRFSQHDTLPVLMPHFAHVCHRAASSPFVRVSATCRSAALINAMILADEIIQTPTLIHTSINEALERLASVWFVSDTRTTRACRNMPMSDNY